MPSKRQRVEQAEKQQREAETIAAEKARENQEMINLQQKIERIQAQIDALQEEHSTNLESETELRRIRQLKKNYQTEFENKKKKWPLLKNKPKTDKKLKKRFKKKEQS